MLIKLGGRQLAEFGPSGVVLKLVAGKEGEDDLVQLVYSGAAVEKRGHLPSPRAA